MKTNQVQSEEGKKQINVRYHNGMCRYAKFGGSAQQVQQVIEVLQAELTARCGSYKWNLDGDTFSGYRIVANYSGGNFTESSGKTPGEALKGFYAARSILRDGYVGEWN